MAVLGVFQLILPRNSRKIPMELLLFRGITVELPWNYSLSTKNYHEMNERGIFDSTKSIYDLDFA